MDGEQHQSHRSGTSYSSSSTSIKQRKQPLTETVSTLKELLRKETYSHKETGHCYDTLQREYDDLLRKYAEAENTIDKLRIGARIKLYYEPQPGQVIDRNNNNEDTTRCKSAQLVHLMAQPQRAHLSRTYSVPDHLPNNKPDHRNHPPPTNGGDNDDDAESQLRNRIQGLQKDVINFQTLLSSPPPSPEEEDDEGTTGNGHHALLGDEQQQQKKIYHALRNEYDLIKEMLKSLDEFNGNNNDTERTRAYSTNSR